MFQIFYLTLAGQRFTSEIKLKYLQTPLIYELIYSYK